MGDIIRIRASTSRIACARVFELGSGRSPSTALVTAMVYAASQAAAVQVVCIPQRAVLSSDPYLVQTGRLLQMLLDRSTTQGKPMPTYVVAIGNTKSSEPIGFPATMRGALVARALDWAGRVATYNCIIPRGGSSVIIDAPGGTPNEPIGNARSSDGQSFPMYGSSYAAGLAAGAIADGLTR